YQNEYVSLTSYFIKNAISKNSTKIANHNPGPLCYSCCKDRMRNYTGWTCGASARCNDNTIYYTVTKLLDNMAFWGQSSDPFNSTMNYSGCSTTGYGRLHAGCVSTAVGQFLKGVYHSGRATIVGNFRFYDMPNYFYNNDYHCISGVNLKNIMNNQNLSIEEYVNRGWLVPFNQYSFNNVLDLFHNINSTLAGGLSGSTIGLAQNCNSFSRPVWQPLYNTGDAFGYLKNACGLNVDYVDYNYNVVRNQINNNTPVLISGSNESGIFSSGHAWTIEGYFENHSDGNFTTYQYVCDYAPIDGGERGIIYQVAHGNGNNNTGYLYVREYNIDTEDRLLFMNWGWANVTRTNINNNTIYNNYGIGYNGWFSSEGVFTRHGGR
ncbi:MAG: C10 family peptidase, partial [Sediminibacterium sp.]|nr:C10 family peptidase [Sediminibacterium sp.]